MRAKLRVRHELILAQAKMCCVNAALVRIPKWDLVQSYLLIKGKFQV